MTRAKTNTKAYISQQLVVKRGHWIFNDLSMMTKDNLKPATFVGFFLVLLSFANVVARVCPPEDIHTCHWEYWGSWSSCSGGTKTRSRGQISTNGNCNCDVLPQIETKACDSGEFVLALSSWPRCNSYKLKRYLYFPVLQHNNCYVNCYI